MEIDASEAQRAVVSMNLRGLVEVQGAAGSMERLTSQELPWWLHGRCASRGSATKYESVRRYGREKRRSVGGGGGGQQ